MLRISVTSVMVEDQEHALHFYTEVLGFVTSKDIPLGEARWLTVVSPEGSGEIELLLEPNSNPAVPAREFQKALYDAGIPATMFSTADVRAEYERLTALGVRFTSEPSSMNGVTTAIFDDTCGNLIVIASV